MNSQLRKVFVSEQTNLIDTLVVNGTFDLENEYDEEDEHNDIYIYWNVSVDYIDLIEEWCNVEHLPFVKNENGMWFGQTWYGTSIENSGVYPSLVERLPFLQEEEVEMVSTGDVPCFFCSGYSENGLVNVNGSLEVLCEDCDIDGCNYNGWIPLCKYGENCYRKCKTHFEEYTH